MFWAHQPFGIGDGFRRMWTELADCNPRPPKHCARTPALTGSRSIAEFQSHRVADSRVVGISKTVRTVDRVGSAGHEVVHLDRIPLPRTRMCDCDQDRKSTRLISSKM